MQIEVRSRVVAAPWERELYLPHREVSVGVEDYVEPDPGPLALYHSAFPHRYVRWDRRRQLWEIRGFIEATGRDERIELLFFYDAPPDPNDQEPRSVDELAHMIETNHRDLVKCYQPFDYSFVRRRLRDYIEHRENADRAKKDPKRTATGRVAERNRALQRSKHRDFTREHAAFLAETRRWWPVLAGENPGARTPLVAGASFNSN